MLADSTLVVANRFFEVLDAAKAELGLAGVFFGDQDIVPVTPALCVEPGVKRRTLAGAQNASENDIETYFLVYHSSVTSDISQQDQRRLNVAVAEDVERFLLRNHLRLLAPDGAQLTIHGYCTDLDPGYSYKAGGQGAVTLYNAVQITWLSKTKTSLQGLF